MRLQLGPRTQRTTGGRSASAWWQTVVRAAVVVVLATASVSATEKKGSTAKPSPSPIATKASTDVSGYADSDNIFVASPSVAATIADPLAGWSVGGHYLVDVVSAASVDIVSTASRGWREVRHAGSLSGTMKVGDFTPGVSGVVSREPDYLSLAGGVTMAVDLFDKNVTPHIGLSYSHDDVGRTGLPHEFWPTKTSVSGQLGVTFVVSRSTIASLQGDAIAESGYLAKPYRYVPLFLPNQAATIEPGASVTEVNNARVEQRPAEQVPNSRHRFALTGRIAHRFEGATLRFDERLYGDSWGVLASTTELRYFIDAGRRFTLWPHLRLHMQDAARFWQRTYTVTVSPSGAFGIPNIRTGDREISPLVNGTLGAGVKFKLIDDVHAPWWLVFEVDGSLTRYFDALYISERRSIFSTLAVETEF